MIRPLRITQIITTDGFAGTERYVVDVANELARRDHEVAVVGGSPDWMPGLLTAAIRWLPGADLRQTLRALLASGRRDVVHSHMTKADFAALIAAPVTGGRRVSTRHIAAPRGWTVAARRLAPLVRGRLAAEIAVSRFIDSALEVPADLVLLNGVSPMPEVTGPRQPVVLLAQRLAVEKDTATALRAWARSGLAATGWRLVVAGDGPERTSLEALARELGASSTVEWLGWVADPAPLLVTSGILLAPAPSEPCGLAVLEAMAAGLPVVAAGAGGHLETLGQLHDAALFPPGDERRAAGHLARLAGDEGLRSAYAARARRLQRERFTLAGHVDRLEQLYARLARD